MVLFKRFGRIQLSLQAGCNEVLAPPSLFELVVGRGQGENDSVFLGGRLSGACSAPPEGKTIRDNNSACECCKGPFLPPPTPSSRRTNKQPRRGFILRHACIRFGLDQHRPLFESAPPSAKSFQFFASQALASVAPTRALSKAPCRHRMTSLVACRGKTHCHSSTRTHTRST